MMTRTLEEFCDGLMSDDHPVERLEPEGFAAEFSAFFGLSGRPTLSQLADNFERAEIGKVSPAKLPSDLRGVHYTLPDGSYAIHYQEGQWEGSSEYTVLHEGYEIVYETLWHRCHDEAPEQKVCADADRFAAAVLMPADIFAAYARASGFDLVALHNVFRCSYPAVALRLGEVLHGQSLAVILYERREQGDPASWPAPTRQRDLRVTVAKQTAGFGLSPSPLLNGWRGGKPHKGKPLSAGSVAERAARSGRPECADGDGLAMVATPVLWKGRLAKVVVVAVPSAQRRVLEAQLSRQRWRHYECDRGAAPRYAVG